MQIKEIYLERSNIYLVFEKPLEGNLEFIQDGASFDFERADKINTYKFCLTNVKDGLMLPTGRYELNIRADNLDGFHLEKKYHYGIHSEYSYDIAIDVKNETVILHSEYSAGKERSIVVEKDKFRYVATSLAQRLVIIAYTFFKLFSKKNIDVLFYSESKRGFSRNIEDFKEHVSEYEVCEARLGNFISTIKAYLVAAAKFAKSKNIIIDDYCSIFNFLDVDSKLIQVWHAGVGFKNVGYARFGERGSPFPKTSSHRKYDAVIVGGEKLVDIYSEVFGVAKSKIYPYGLPRLEKMFDSEKISSFKQQFFSYYPGLKTKKIVLFAPTFRGENANDAYYPYEYLDLASIGQQDDWVFLLKFHPFITKPMEITSEYTNKVIDVSTMNIDDLYHITDVLITDYSSCFYDFSMFLKPILFYWNDYEEYLKSRGIQSNYEDELPGIKCMSFADIIAALNNKFDLKKVEKFRDGYLVRDNNSSEKIIQLLD